MVNTWDPKEKKLLPAFTLHANSCFVYGLMSRFAAKRSEVLACAVTGGKEKSFPRVFAAALRSPKGQFTAFVLNDAPAAWKGSLRFKGLEGRPLHVYRVTAETKDRADLRVEPGRTLEAKDAVEEDIPPRSLTVYTTFRLAHEDRGIIVE
jgi:hypothetical protein